MATKIPRALGLLSILWLVGLLSLFLSGKRTFTSTDRLCLFKGPELASVVAFAGPSPRTAVRGLACAKRELILGLPWPSEYLSSQTRRRPRQWRTPRGRLGPRALGEDARARPRGLEPLEESSK